MKTSGIRLENLNPKARALIDAELRKERTPRGTADLSQIEVIALPKERRIRQEQGPRMNKLETAYYEEILLSRYKREEILPQELRLRLANGDWYKPDFWVPHMDFCFEVKGPKSFRGGFEFLKIAAAKHKHMHFFLVWRVGRASPWRKQLVLP